MSNKINILLIAIFLKSWITPAFSQDLTEVEKEVLLTAAKNTVLEYIERTNLIAIDAYTEPQTFRLIEDMFRPLTFENGMQKENISQVFTEDARIDDDIVEPAGSKDSAKVISVEVYLRNFYQFYDKKKEIEFTNLEVGPVRQEEYIYIQVRYDKNILGRNLNSPGVSYPTSKRLAEIKAVKTNGKWKTLITRISFAKLADEDRDGIDDFYDLCPATKTGISVNKNGCPDKDRDGIADTQDNCPETIPGCSVDQNGCPLDDDGDGICNSFDQCQETPPGCQVDLYGCPVDNDNDGVCDDLDRCPGTPAGVSVNSDGCPNDLDFDGVPDEADKCPGTMTGCKVDKYGCILDSDGDGVCDNLDQCPGTKTGLKVNQHGCSIDKRRIGINYTFVGDPWENSPLSNFGLVYYGNSVSPLGFYISGITYFDDTRPEYVYSSQQMANIIAEYEINMLQYTPLEYISTQADLFAFDAGFSFKPFPFSTFLNGFHLKIGYSYLNGEIWEIHSGAFGDEVATIEEGINEYAVNYSKHKSGNFALGGVVVVRFVQVEFIYNHLYNSFQLSGGLNIGF